MATKNTTLAMNQTTIGYSQKGINELKNKISENIKAKVKIVDPATSQKFTTLVQTLDDYWDGNDYDNFVADIKTMASALANELKVFDKNLGYIIQSYATQFAKFQNTVYTKGSIKLSDVRIRP